MWWLLAVLPGIASPEPPFAREGEALRVREYRSVRGNGPVKGSGAQKGGAVRAWVFPDGTIEHYQVRKGRVLAEEHRFDALGRPVASTRFEGGVPARVTVLGYGAQAEVDTRSWAEAAIDGLVVRGPGPPAAEGSARRWIGAGWSVAVQAVPEAGVDPFSEGYRAGLLEGCACAIEDRSTSWMDGRAAARYRLRSLDPTHAWTSEVWAASQGTTTWLLVSTAESDPAALAWGRALAALARWEDGR